MTTSKISLFKLEQEDQLFSLDDHLTMHFGNYTLSFQKLKIFTSKTSWNFINLLGIRLQGIEKPSLFQVQSINFGTRENIEDERRSKQTTGYRLYSYPVTNTQYKTHKQNKAYMSKDN